jgi:hypothetical protein
MRLTTAILILAAGIVISAMAYVLSGGRVAFFFLPLIFGLPLMWRR